MFLAAEKPFRGNRRSRLLCAITNAEKENMALGTAAQGCVWIGRTIAFADSAEPGSETFLLVDS